MEVVVCQPYAPDAFTPRVILLEAESAPGHVDLLDATGKIPATPGTYHGTLRLEAQCLNHYATPGPRNISTIYVYNKPSIKRDGRSRDQFPVVSLEFSVTYSFRPYHDPGVDSAPSESEYQEHFLGVKAAGA